MAIQCPVCETQIADPNHTVKCQSCGFPLKEPSGMEYQLNPSKVKTFILAVKEWGKEVLQRDVEIRQENSTLKLELTKLHQNFNTVLSQQQNIGINQINDKFNHGATNVEISSARVYKNYEALGTGNEIEHSKISLFTTTNVIPQIYNFLDVVNKNLLEPYNMYDVNQKRIELKQYYAQFYKYFEEFVDQVNNIEKSLNQTNVTAILEAPSAITQIEPQNITHPASLEETASLVANILLKSLVPIISEQVQEIKKSTPIISEQVQEIKKSQLQIEYQLNNQLQSLTELLTKGYQNPPIQNTPEQDENNIPSNNQTDDESIIQTSTVHEENSQVGTLSDISKSIPSWLNIYNKNPESFEKDKYIELSITAESIHNGRMGVNQPVILENQRKGNYWIFVEDNTTTKGKYLVPKANFKITEYALEPLKLLFNVNEDNLGNYSKLIVTQPALVISIDQDKWQLVELGILQLESDN